MGTLFIVCGLILASLTGMAQVDTGTILGVVKHQAGAVMPGAKVTIILPGFGTTPIAKPL